MGNRNIKKEAKKPKKSDKKGADVGVSSVPSAMAIQPALIKKDKKIK